MTHPLITDEAVKSAAKSLPRYVDENAVAPYLRAALDAFVAHHEGERPCERCSADPWIGCPACGGTGKQREDRVVMEEPTRADERQAILEASVRAWQGEPPRCEDDCEGMGRACRACAVNDIHGRVERTERAKVISEVVAAIEALPTDAGIADALGAVEREFRGDR